MHKAATAHPACEYRMNPYMYTITSNIQDIAAIMQSLIVSGIEPVALVTISLYFTYRTQAPKAPSIPTDRSISYFLDHLHPLIRKTDIVFLLDHTYYFILPGANEQGGAIVQERLWEALQWRVHNIHNSELLCPSMMTAGYSAYPALHQDISQCIVAAQAVRLSADLQPEQMPQVVVPAANSHRDLALQASKLSIPYLPQLPDQLPTKTRQLISPALAQDLHCCPLGSEHGILTVALADLQDHHVLKRLQQETGMQIFPVLTYPQELQRVLEELV